MRQEDKEMHKISRRQFVTGAAASVAAVTAGGVLAGCAPKVATTQAPIPTAEAVTAVPVVAANDAPVTMNAALASTKWSFEIPPAPIADSDIASTVTSDIIVVGSGTAGLVCANSAVENGAKVVLISASKGNISRGGSNHAMNSKVMKAANITPVGTDLFFRNQLTMAGYHLDQEKWWKFAKNSEESMDWLIDKMEAAGYKTVLELSNIEPGDPKDVPVGSHSWIGDKVTASGSGQQFVVDTLAKLAQAAGVQIIYQMVAEQLVRENNNTGRVTAVIAKGADGKYIKYIGTKAIVLATGDFSADKEMMAKYCPRVLPLLDDTGDQGYENAFKMGGIYKGDGQKMGLWIGAAWQKSTPNAPMIGGGAGPAPLAYGSHLGLCVNKYGHRYSNEDNSSTYAGESMLLQPERKVYAIWGTNYAQDAAPWHSFGQIYGDPAIPVDEVIAGWETSVKNKSMVKADTIEGVISALGLPAADAKATVDRYNQFCASGVDEDFFKRKELLVPIGTGPFYGQQGGLMFLTVLGGLRTNINMQVCDDNDQPIPGLYNIGTMVGDYFGNTYNFLVQGNNLGANCVTFGYTTGRDIAKGTV
jgi:fumarate reductase flavoprotein subunit